MAARKKEKRYRVKKAHLGKVKLQSGTGELVLDDSTPQSVLAGLYDTVLGKGFIELVAATAPTQTQDNEAG